MRKSEHPPSAFDAVVIGAGVIGAATTFELGRRGRRPARDRQSHPGGKHRPPLRPPGLGGPDDYDQRLAPEQWEAQVLRLNRRLPSLGVPHERKGVVDLYDVSDDWIPIYDRTDLDGFYVAIGTSGNQFKNAGVAGHCMTELIEAVEAGHDHDHDPLVVNGRYTGLPIDMGTFSRNREVNLNSSMSVHG